MACSASPPKENRNVAVDSNVRESGNIDGDLEKSYLFCLTVCLP